MNFEELVKKNRSYRGYSQTIKLTRTEIEEILNLARYCPSSVNFQPFKYYISSDKKTNDLIQPLTGWARRIKDQKLPREGHNPTAFVVICYDNMIGSNAQRFMKDVGIVAQTILLSAVDMGFGGIMIGNFSAEKVASTLELAPNLEPVLILALGKPDEKVKIVSVDHDGDIAYRRDESHITYVPKRSLQDILINNRDNDCKWV